MIKHASAHWNVPLTIPATNAGRVDAVTFTLRQSVNKLGARTRLNMLCATTQDNRFHAAPFTNPAIAWRTAMTARLLDSIIRASKLTKKHHVTLIRLSRTSAQRLDVWIWQIIAWSMSNFVSIWMSQNAKTLYLANGRPIRSSVTMPEEVAHDVCINVIQMLGGNVRVH